MRKGWIGVLALAGGLALGAACEENGPRSSSERGGTTSTPTARGPAGDRGNDTSSGAASSGSAAPMTSERGTGGSGDAGMGADAGTRMR